MIDYRFTVWRAVRGKELGRPVTLNAERNQGHWGGRSNATDKWLRATRKVVEEGIEAGEFSPLAVAVVQIVPLYLRGPLPDVGNIAPTAKAVIDGIVEAGLLPDDNPFHVEQVVHLRPKIGTTNGVVVRVLEGQPLTGHRYGSCNCAEMRRAKQGKGS